MTLTLTYDQQLCRVRATADALPGSVVTCSLRRSVDDGIRWADVRGATGLSVWAGALELPADDYEFAADVPNRYQLRGHDGAGNVVFTTTATITPDLAGQPWLKVIARPFLNRPVTVHDYSDVERPSRAGVHEIVGRSLPVVVSDVRGSRRFELVLRTDTDEERDAVDLAFASGEPVFLHVPPAADIPGGYLHVDTVTMSRPARRSQRRLFSAPVVEIAPPAPDVVGAVSTWQTVLNSYATWADVLADHATWAELLELIGSPQDVIVE